MAFSQDFFISYERNGATKAKELLRGAERFGLKGFFSEEHTPPGEQLATHLKSKIEESRHFILVAEAGVSDSSWVRREWEHFKERCYDPDRRNVFVLAQDPKYVLAELQGFVFKADPEALLIYICRMERKRLEEKLAASTEKLTHAFNSYKYDRFWGPLAQDGADVHILTCGRGEADGARSYRTNIDKWDYQAVVDLTHFFASRYPKTNVRIENPVEKMAVDESVIFGKRMANIEAWLRENPNCVIVGSPDVNDFAEITMAKAHGIEPYSMGTHGKRTGFQMVKGASAIKSSFYRQRESDEEEGVFALYGPRLPKRAGTDVMSGILLAGRNPFNHEGRVVVLSGFSGVATSAMAKFLTDETYIGKFQEFDRVFDPKADLEALIAVKYLRQPDGAHGDQRQIQKGGDAIFFVDVAPILDASS